MLSLIDIKVKKLSSHAIIPTYAHPDDAGADLYSIENFVLVGGARHLTGTGVAIEIPQGYVGLVHPRSGLAHKHGISIVNAPGTIDSTYRGEIKVNLINLTPSPVRISAGDRIAQIVFQKYSTALFVEVEEIESTERGENGHGSSGGLQWAS